MKTLQKQRMAAGTRASTRRQSLIRAGVPYVFLSSRRDDRARPVDQQLARLYSPPFTRRRCAFARPNSTPRSVVWIHSRVAVRLGIQPAHKYRCARSTLSRYARIAILSITGCANVLKIFSDSSQNVIRRLHVADGYRRWMPVRSPAVLVGARQFLITICVACGLSVDGQRRGASAVPGTNEASSANWVTRR